MTAHRIRSPIFWLTGLLSAFLDNAPTYVVFFELAGGDAADLMGSMAATLAAISMGAVYMGALTYIGNAPNLMVYAMAVERGSRCRASSAISAGRSSGWRRSSSS